MNIRSFSLPAVALATCLSLIGCGGDADVAPTATELEPAAGSQLGGTEVVITGARFLAGTPNDVLFGDVIAESVNVISDTELLVVTPPGAGAGAVDVTVFNANGFATLAGGFSYVAQPEIAAVNPVVGDFKGGETVTVMGSGFQNNDAGRVRVFWDGVELDPDRGDFTVTSDSAIDVVTPPGPIFASVDVRVENANGESLGSFEYEGRGLLAMARFNNAPVFFVDVTDGTVVRITREDDNGNTGARAMITLTDGRVLSLDRNKTVSEVDIATGLQARLGQLTGGSGDQISGITVVNEQYFGVQGCRDSPSNGSLASIDLESFTITEVGGTQVGACPGGQGSCGAIAANSSGVTYHLRRNGADSNLHTVNVSTGAISGSPTVITDRTRLNSMTFFNDDLYALDRSAREILKVDVVTGVVQIIASFNNDLHGMTATP